MNILNKHILQFYFLCFILVFGACKEPTDLGGNIIIEPKSTKKISTNDISLSYAGKGNFSSFNQRDTDEPTWSLKSFTITDLSIDTTSTQSIKVSMDGEGIIIRDIVSDNAKSFPTKIRFHIDSLIIPSIPSDPKNLLPPKPIFLDDAELDIIVYNRKLINGIQKIEPSVKKIALIDREIFLKSFASSFRCIPGNSIIDKGELQIFLQFFIPNIEVINENKREKSIISGETVIKLKW